MPNFLIDEDTSLLAAEFVLGTLDSQEYANAQSLLKVDHAFTAMVRIWERRFGELHLIVEPVEPDGKIFERIKAKLATIPQAAPAPGKLPDPLASPEPFQPAPPWSPPIRAAGEFLPAATSPGEAEPGKVPEASAGNEGPNMEPTEPKPEPTAATDPIVVPQAAPSPGEKSPAEETPRIAGSPVAETRGVPAPPLQSPAPLKLPDKQRDRRRELKVIRSRRRWRALGIFMTLVVAALTGLISAWRIVPDRLPPALRPAEVMTAIGIEPDLPGPQPTDITPPPPESQFDE